MPNAELRVITPEEMTRWDAATYLRMNEWAKANNLTPRDISVKHPLSVEYVDSQHVIRYHRISRDPDGGFAYDKATGLIATTVQLVPLVVPLP